MCDESETMSTFDEAVMDFQGWLDGDQPLTFCYRDACEHLTRVCWTHRVEVSRLKRENASLRSKLMNQS